jgi:hypothetical protein
MKKHNANQQAFSFEVTVPPRGGLDLQPASAPARTAQWLNPPEAHEAAGRGAGLARFQNDEARAQSFTEHANRMRNAEPAELQAEARRLFDLGYRSGTQRT